MTDDEGVEGTLVGSKQAAMAGSAGGESVLWLLPDELLLYILGFLDARCLGSVTQVGPRTPPLTPPSHPCLAIHALLFHHS